MTSEQIRRRACRLIDAWIDGNRKEVVEEILEQADPATLALYAAIVAVALAMRGGVGDTAVLFQLLDNRRPR